MWREDFSKEHVDKTVTYETHPHLGFSCPSIHPCKYVPFKALSPCPCLSPPSSFLLFPLHPFLLNRHAQAMQRLIALTVSGHEGAQLDVK